MTKARELFADEQAYLTHQRNLAEIAKRGQRAAIDPKQFRNYELPRKWAKQRYQREYARRWRANHPERAAEISRATYHRNRDANLRRMRSNYRAHREQRLLAMALYAREHHTERLAYWRAYDQAHHEQRRAKGAEYRAAHRGEIAARARARLAANRDAINARRRELHAAKKPYAAKKPVSETLQWAFARQDEALRLREQGHSCEKVAQQVGYANRGSARLAAMQALKRREQREDGAA